MGKLGFIGFSVLEEEQIRQRTPIQSAPVIRVHRGPSVILMGMQRGPVCCDRLLLPVRIFRHTTVNTARGAEEF